MKFWSNDRCRFIEKSSRHGRRLDDCVNIGEVGVVCQQGGAVIVIHAYDWAPMSPLDSNVTERGRKNHNFCAIGKHPESDFERNGTRQHQER